MDVLNETNLQVKFHTHFIRSLGLKREQTRKGKTCLRIIMLQILFIMQLQENRIREETLGQTQSITVK